MAKRQINLERARRLRDARETRGMTRAEVCEATGIPAATLRAAENGVRVPTAIKRLVEFYGAESFTDPAEYIPLERMPRTTSYYRAGPPHPGGRPRMPLPEGMDPAKAAEFAAQPGDPRPVAYSQHHYPGAAAAAARNWEIHRTYERRIGALCGYPETGPLA
ncbi:helix-turn-helix domain-containing protein [Streptomyces sp. NPDC058525]|uniref:helix-turn-helix domain-containing protein n=1 Tax=Streptomyces sp. NPDC058525 TaxID=3346538 RepID=UPI00364E6D84